jgi:hypothetical protein
LGFSMAASLPGPKSAMVWDPPCQGPHEPTSGSCVC